MPLETFTTWPVFINDPDATGVCKMPDPKGATHTAKIVTRNAGGVTAVSFEVDAANKAILLANGYV